MPKKKPKPSREEKQQKAYEEARRRIEECRRTGDTTLDLSAMGLRELPLELWQLTALTELSVQHNQLRDLPSEIGLLPKLTELDLSFNQIRHLPNELGQLTALKRLYLQCNQLRQLPSMLGRLTALRGLYLSRNQLRKVPHEIGQLTALTTLYLSFNLLAELPREVGELIALNDLDVSNNKLRELMSEFGQLTALTELDLSRNQLRELPYELGQLLALRRLFLHGNPDLGIPAEVLGPTWNEVHGSPNTEPASPAAILDYYFSKQAKTARSLNEVKLLLVGRGGAGKTSMVERLMRDGFNPKQESTTGIALQDWSLECPGGDPVTVHVWDFAGQVIAHATHQFFFSARSVYVLVLTGREDAQRDDAEYWLRLIRAFGTHVDERTGQPVTSRVLVALNKWDEAPVKLDREALREKYPFIAGYVETDCRSGRGIAELKEKLKEVIGADPSVREKVGAEYFAVKEALRKRWHEGQVNHLDYAEFEKVCADAGVTEPQRQKGFAEMLHRLGLALNYGDDPRIRDTTVLNPHWVTDGIYLLLREAPNHRAELTLEAACEKLPKEEERRVMFLIRLMQKYDLAFPLREEEDKWLVPQALADSQPKLGPEWQDPEATRLRWTYAALPEGLVPRFITRTHTLSEGQERWLNGAILVLGEARAVVRADTTDRRISAMVIGPAEERQLLAGTIQAEMRALNAEIRGLDPREELQMQRDPEVWLPVKGLEKAEQAGKETMDVLTADGSVEVKPKEENNRLTSEDARTDIWKPRVFISYSHKDDAARDKMVQKLKVLKTAGLVEFWMDRDLEAGAEWDGVIRDELEKMDVFVLLVSDHSLVSEYISRVEIKHALERHDGGSVKFVPVILQRCSWKACKVFDHLVALPKYGKPIKDFKPQNHGWHDVSEALERLFKKLKEQHAGERRGSDEPRIRA